MKSSKKTIQLTSSTFYSNIDSGKTKLNSCQTAPEEFQKTLLASEINVATRNYLISQKAYSRFCADKLNYHVSTIIHSLGVDDLSKIHVFNKHNNKIGIEILKRSRH